MSTSTPELQPPPPAIIHQVPDWEAPSSKAPKKSFLSVFSPKSSVAAISKEELGQRTDTEPEVGSVKRTFSDRWIPHRCSCFGRSRGTCICSLIALLLLLLVLGLGLGLGLTHKLHDSSSSPQNLPLPSTAGINTGDLTYYSPGPGYGACGYQNSSTEAICAVSYLVWDATSTSSNPNLSPLCGKMIRITRYDTNLGTNRSVDVEVVDKCEKCAATDLDLSLKMFTSLADESLGRVQGSWAWLS